MDRRGFLRLFGGAGVSAVVAPTYFFAPKRGWKPEYDQVLSAGFPPVPMKLEGYPVSYADMVVGGSKRYVHQTYAIENPIAYDALTVDPVIEWLDSQAKLREQEISRGVYGA